MTQAPPLPDLGQLSDADKARLLGLALRTRLDASIGGQRGTDGEGGGAVTARVAELEAK